MFNKGFIILVSLVFAYSGLSAQFLCKTSNVPNIGSLCQIEQFEPVCGCDSVTYRHPCDAYRIHNVQFYTNGICNNQAFAVDMYPIPFDQSKPLKLAVQMQNNTTGSFQILIWDTYGALQLQRSVYNAYRFDLTLDAYRFHPGVYIVAVVSTSGSYFVRKKIMVTSI